MTILPLLLVVVTAVSFGLGVIYRYWIRPVVCFHFGEEYPSRRNDDARERRRAFEGSCRNVLLCYFVAGLINAIGGIVAIVPPKIVIGGHLLAFGITAIFTWAAISRWRNPFSN